MSLKIFHAFFILISALMCFGIAWFGLIPVDSNSALATVSAISGVALLIYGAWFLYKYRSLSNL